MYADYDIRISEDYPHGAFCECGRVIHLKESEALEVDNIITCPVCGFRMHLYRPSLAATPSSVKYVNCKPDIFEQTYKEV